MAPFPYLPMVAIMMTLVTDMVVHMNVVAYSGFMVQHLGVVDNKDRAGYYAGSLSSAFMLGWLVSSHFWGLVADRYGCRFVMVFGLFITVPLSVAFGCSPTFGWAVAVRALLGLLNGSFVACKSVVSDVCGKEHDTVGMGVVTAAFSLGQVLGPGVGGILSEPATHHSGTFSQSGIFGRYPYLLPNLVVAGMSLVALPLVLLFIEGPKRAEGENPTSSCAWIPSWCNCGGGDNDKGNNNHNSNDDCCCSKADSNALSVTKQPSSSLPIEPEASSGIRLPSWMQIETGTGTAPPPAVATRGGSGWHDDTEGLERDARSPKQKKSLPRQPEASSGIRLPSWMQIETWTGTAPPPAAATRGGSGSHDDTESLERDARDPEEKKSLLWQPHIRILLIIDALYSLTYPGLEAVFTLWALSDVSKGGLDWSAVEIGQVFFACGVMLLAFELLAVPILTPRWGVRFCQRLGSVVEVPIYFLIPLLSHMSGAGLVVRIFAAALLFLFLAGSDPFYIGLSLAVNNATGPDRRGELNGINTTSSSLTRSLSPVIFSALFAYSIEGDHIFPFDYHLAFYCNAFIRLAVAVLGWNRICDNGGIGARRMMFGE